MILSTLDPLDLLYAHGCLCEYAHDSKFVDVVEARNLAMVINNFQRELKNHLRPDATKFAVSCSNRTHLYYAAPIGGWDE